ncbi:K+-transporting ATPase, B subunit [Myxococcus xanthus DK 1622]|uniref:Potassium-transporting ATPase ATP-binding subunit n=1 Tax=Myxococcus xanthus (strain DK1622) TaxID=246197 RepID=Q1DFX5_MYXXD|nr:MULTISPECIES: potassium-transporting ATPase subunit KdpB [Myxococcus]ABF92970.1 K+-transporting ATPase, B subunit [Myxococcus xanthus DK 1622]NOJ54559.1 potassium-transporting ATPase subunit KdpB [Myxococcus xanthus]QPM79896.1 potassium-transporting ATPase subunit KdpB [Myxococcus xanthus]QVW68960.1 potassium-transporting ATPase subunit KdpB [Myxococcus xanthus DZ2]QZZ47725.1 Potassium-transporting ATPase ATP-binding subunit [Myxococcus xanthus]
MSSPASKPASLLDASLLKPAMVDSLRKLHPRDVARNPVMFVVWAGSLLTTVLVVKDLVAPRPDAAPLGFTVQVTLWLWFTVLFANFAEAVAEGRGKAQAGALRKMRKETTARRWKDGREERVPAPDLRKGDEVICEAGDLIPGDGEVVEGIASVDESAITGESAPVIRESGGDRSAVTGGTKVLSDRIRVRISANPGDSFLDRMIGLVEGAARQKTPNEVALHILLVGLTLIFLLACVTLVPLALYSGVPLSGTAVVALLVCLIPTTIGGLLSAIGIAGMDRLLRKNVLAMSGRAVEAAGDVDTLLLDKTGTITLGNRMATELLPMPGVRMEELAEAAQLASLADETPEGRSIVTLVKDTYKMRPRELQAHHATFVPFTAQTRMSGCDLVDPHPRSIRKGAVDAIVTYVRSQGGAVPDELAQASGRIGDAGGTPLAVADGARLLGIIHLKDVVKGGIKERFDRFRAMGIRTVMITGDNPRTAAAIAREAGVDDFLAEATPEAKLALIRTEQGRGKLVAMTGDGTNDAPALAQADVGVAMNTGTQAAKEAGNMVDLDSNPTKLLEVVEVGKQLLMTRGTLTTFSIANDVAKYFAILPALFMGVFPQIAPLNVMGLSSPFSAVLSAVIFNALIIILLIPLALKGVRYRPLGAEALLRRSLLLYGVGGVIVPFVGIKVIDVLLGAVGLA